MAVSSDGNELVFFSTYQPPGATGPASPDIWRSDLFVSFRRADAGWGEPQHLGVTPDRKYFFFSRRLTIDGVVKAGDVYWLDATFLEQFRK